MVDQSSSVALKVSEYKCLLAKAEIETTSEFDASAWRRLESILMSDAEWTQKGAENIVKLAREQGAFVLRNALALSVALRIEDGDAGY